VKSALRELPPLHFVTDARTHPFVKRVEDAAASDSVVLCIVKMSEQGVRDRFVPSNVPITFMERVLRLHMLMKECGTTAGVVVIPIGLESRYSDSEKVLFLGAWFQLVAEKIAKAIDGSAQVLTDFEIEHIDERHSGGLHGLSPLMVGRDLIAAAVLQQGLQANHSAHLIRMLSEGQVGKTGVTSYFHEDAVPHHATMALRSSMGFVFTRKTYDLQGRETHPTVWRDGEGRVRALHGEFIADYVPEASWKLTRAQYHSLLAFRGISTLGVWALPGIADQALVDAEKAAFAQCLREDRTSLSMAELGHALMAHQLVHQVLPRMMDQFCPTQDEVAARAAELEELVRA